MTYIPPSMHNLSAQAPTAASASVGTITVAGGQEFRFATTMRKAFVQSHHDSGVMLYLSFNSTTASTTDWDIVLDAGDLVITPDGLCVDKITIFSDGAVVYGTGFVVRGWA